MPFLLDTNTVSDLIKNPQGRVAGHVARVGEDAVFTSIIVVAELRCGAARKNSQRLEKQLETVLGGMEIFAFDAPADRVYGEVRAKLQAVGKPMGANDMLIAAHAMALGHTLVTDNEREFARVEGLAIENWLR